jgi:hypothetical protein
MSCYNFDLVQIDEGYLDDSVDATYIIHLEGNKERLQNIHTQLHKYPLTKLNYILLNKGYKKCNKELPHKLPAVDLIDSFLTIFKDAKEKNYNNILILEDDFFYDECIKDKKIQDEINVFLNDNKNKKIIYHLGCIPFLQIPSLTPHNRILISIGMHSCIYTRPLRETILNHDIYSYFSSIMSPDWDIYCNFCTTRYMYYKPLCYQLFPNTQNSKQWAKNFFNFGAIIKYLLNGLYLNKQIYPGYNYCYLVSNLQLILFVILLSIMIISLLR